MTYITHLKMSKWKFINELLIPRLVNVVVIHHFIYNNFNMIDNY